MLFSGKIKEERLVEIKKSLQKYLYENMLISCNENSNRFDKYTILSIKTILHALLMQEDKLAMAHSVESRVPFVDSNNLVDLALNCSNKVKLADDREKYILRKYGENLLPESIVSRKKYPFPEPPFNYSKFIKKQCEQHWKDISNGIMVKNIIKEEYLSDINSFNDVELWWMLVYWRFEHVFKICK